MTLVLWGFHARQAEPIKLTGGTLAHCRSERSARAAQGWTCGIYAAGVSPTALRIMAAQA